MKKDGDRIKNHASKNNTKMICVEIRFSPILFEGERNCKKKKEREKECYKYFSAFFIRSIFHFLNFFCCLELIFCIFFISPFFFS